MKIKPYDFNGKTVRIIIRDNGSLEWVSFDVCVALGIKNSRHAVSTLDPDEKSSVVLSDGAGGLPRSTVTEPGLYRLIGKSKKKTAKKFQRWVYHDVLPTIRKTGSYSVHSSDIPKTLPEALRKYADTLDENNELKGRLSVVEPKAIGYDQISNSDGLICISDCAKILQIKPHTFSRLLLMGGHCIMRRKKLIPSWSTSDKNWMQVKQVMAKDGSNHSYRQTFVTPLGVAEFRKIYRPEDSGPRQKRLFG